jgi:hypothetical protein
VTKLMVHTWTIDGFCHLLVCQKDATTVVAKVQATCMDTSTTLVLELQRRFPNHKIMSEMGIMYPQ